MAEPEIHNITFDVSGHAPQDGWRVSPPQPTPTHMRMASMNLWEPQSTPNQNCNVSCDTTPNPGTTGVSGISPPKAPAGVPDGGPAAPDGSCNAGQSPNGFPGGHGGSGGLGAHAGNGGAGGIGFNAGNINVFIRDGDTNQYS